jgi:hypothetical protein
MEVKVSHTVGVDGKPFILLGNGRPDLRRGKFRRREVCEKEGCESNFSPPGGEKFVIRKIGVCSLDSIGRLRFGHSPPCFQLFF